MSFKNQHDSSRRDRKSSELRRPSHARTDSRAQQSRARHSRAHAGYHDPHRPSDYPSGGVFARICAIIPASRDAIVLALFCACAVVFLALMVNLQFFDADQYIAKAKDRERSYPINARRGTIYDRNGVVLATSVEAKTISCNPSKMEDVRDAAEKIASVLGGKARDYEEKINSGTDTFAYIKRQATLEEAEKLKELNIPGIEFADDYRREYPNGSIGGQVIGICDVDGNGKSGLELQYDEELKGEDGWYAADLGRSGMPIPGGVSENEPARDGQDIMVSIDIKLQDTVERALKEGVEAKEIDGEKGTSVVMDAQTGEIYAACSLPLYDPTGESEYEAGSESLKPITEAFEPGSVFKTVSALTVLEHQAMGPEDTLYCPRVIQADEYEISDAHDRGDETMTLRQILNRSSNVGISLAINKVGFDKLNDAIERFGLNQPTGVDFKYENSGMMQPFDSWARITGYNVSFGQGLTTTPLQMTRFYAMIANGGSLVTPHFLIEKPQTGEVPEYEKKKVVDNEVAIDQITSMLRTVVEEGTGTDAAIDGYEVVGKTSTAEIAENGSYAENRYNLCFAGFIDHSSSDLVCFVSANDVYSEASVCSIFQAIMSDAIEQYNIVAE